MTVEAINPATGEVTATWPWMDDQAINELLNQARSAYLQYKLSTMPMRSELLSALGKSLEEDALSWATLITETMGKPITDAKKEVLKCASTCQYFSEEAPKKLELTHIPTEMKKSYVSYKPIGPILAIMPWNYPLWQVIRFLAPNLMLGNTMILNHSPIVTAIGLKLEETMRSCGFLESVFRTILMNYDQAADVIADPRIAGISLTGSDRAGSIVAGHAGRAVKPAVIECGGSDPYIVLKDANLELAAKTCVAMRLANSGQVCISAKRMIVVESVFEEFKALVMSEVQGYNMGNPMGEQVKMGPLARSDLRDTVHQQVQKTIAEGATCHMGGEMPEGEGFYYPITLLTGVDSTMTAFKEEVFGPVICLIVARDEGHAIELANEHQYGLSAAVFTDDLERGERIARDEIQVGVCMVNRGVTSDPRLPFGGIKRSGFGRELGTESLRSFANIKTIGVVKSA